MLREVRLGLAGAGRLELVRSSRRNQTRVEAAVGALRLSAAAGGAGSCQAYGWERGGSQPTSSWGTSTVGSSLGAVIGSAVTGAAGGPIGAERSMVRTVRGASGAET